MNERVPRGPLVQPGEELPGRWVADSHSGLPRVWNGASDWHTQHGKATVQWSLGRVSYVWNAAFADGSRADVAGMQPANNLFRRPVGGAYEYGSVDIGADDVIFTRAAEALGPVLEVNDDVRGLFDVLMRDEAFVRDVRDLELARALYSVLENATFLKGDDRYEFGQRSAGHFVAALRKNGEVYFDFAWGGNRDAADIAKLEAHFARLGIFPRAPHEQ